MIKEFLEFLKEADIEFYFLGENLIVRGPLDLRSTKITSLPENLVVEGFLDLRSTKITSLPENLVVDGTLDLSDTKITSLPENLSVGGSLDLSCTKITSLPENLRVGGYLDLSDTKITSLPENLRVGNLFFNPKMDLKGISAYRENCGKYRRTIYAVKIGNEIKCIAGCFYGDFDTFCIRVKAEYDEESGNAYIAKMKECVDEVILKTGGVANEQ